MIFNGWITSRFKNSLRNFRYSQMFAFITQLVRWIVGKSFLRQILNYLLMYQPRWWLKGGRLILKPKMNVLILNLEPIFAVYRHPLRLNVIWKANNVKHPFALLHQRVILIFPPPKIRLFKHKSRLFSRYKLKLNLLS